MAYIRFMKGRLVELPEQIQDGRVYVLKSGEVDVDMGSDRVRINPPADWENTNKNSPAYIANKPELGTAAAKDVAEQLDLTSNLPTSKQVSLALRERDQLIATIQDALGNGFAVAQGVADLTNTDMFYVYKGENASDGTTNFVTNNWYYYYGGKWVSGGEFTVQGVETDTSLLVGGAAADSAAVGNRLTSLQADTEELYVKVSKLQEFQTAQEILNETYADDMEVTDDGLVWLLNNSNRISGPHGPFAGNGYGGGGGGGGSYDTIDAVFSAQNNNEWNTLTISEGDDAYFSFTWESLENDAPNGNGTVTITVNNIVRATLSVPQGENSINLKSYYGSGTNKIRIRVSDQYDQGKSWIVNINVISLTVTSSFITSFPFNSAITFPYTPTGNVSKTVYFIIDKDLPTETVYTNVTSISGKQLSQTFPAQPHGSHTLTVYFEAEVNGATVRSNTLYYEFIAISQGATEPIIVSPFNATEQKQYSVVIIPYQVYDPQSTTAELKIYIDDYLVSTQTVDQNQHSYSYKANHPGTVEIRFVSGTASKTITLNVTESDVVIAADSEDMPLYLNAQGRSNNEGAAERQDWSYNDIHAQFTNFEWQLDGWMLDSDGVNVLRTIGDARVTIPYKPFATNFVGTGKTIEIEFSTHNVIDYNTTIISCFANDIGFEITPQTITFKGTQTEIMTPFKDNEHIRATIVVHKQNANRLVLLYINGIMSGAIQYPSGESFRQGDDNVAVGISIGSNLCAVDIYTIRIYDKDLSREEVINNWIADTQLGDVMLDRYNRNNIFDNGVINPNTLPSNLPYFIINGTDKPQYKGDKKVVTLTFTDPVNPNKSFSAEGVEIDVQGTSSQAYFRKNYDLKFKKGFDTRNGHVDSYSIINAVPFNRFVLKADVASSESANNTLLTMLYCEMSPFQPAEKNTDSRIRLGIEGRPCVVFWYNPDTGVTEFLGKAA